MQWFTYVKCKYRSDDHDQVVALVTNLKLQRTQCVARCLVEFLISDANHNPQTRLQTETQLPARLIHLDDLFAPSDPVDHVRETLDELRRDKRNRRAVSRFERHIPHVQRVGHRISPSRRHPPLLVMGYHIIT